MAQFLFPNFLNDPNEYRQAEMLWRERWDELVRRVGQEGQWVTPWLTTTFADGTPFADGNPILSAVAPARRLGVRVIQVEPSEEPQELSYWTHAFAEGQPEAIKALVLACALNSQTLEAGLGIMERWITTEELGSAEESAWGSPADVTDLDGPQEVA
jgi:hypothetical protein